MADAAILGSDLSTLGALITYVGSNVIRAGRAKGAPLKSFMDVSGDIADKGVAVNVLQEPTISTGLLTEGAAIALSNSTGTKTTVTLNKHRYAALSFNVVAQALGGSSNAQNQVNARITGLLNDIEADVLSVITAGFTTNTVGSYNSAITEANILGAVRLLDEQKASSPRIGLVRHDANAWGALAQLSGFKETQITGQINPNNTPDNGENGRLWHGVNWFKCQSLPKSTNNIDNAVITTGSLLAAMRPLAVSGPGQITQNFVDAESGVAFAITASFNSGYLTSQVVVHALYGYNVGKEAYGVLFKS